ncbi:MAG: LptF/LptG family permease [Brevinema sp.]
MLERVQLFFYANFFTAMDRLIYKELFLNYMIGVSFFSSIIMINELYYIIRYYFEQNVPLGHVFAMIGALIPFLVSFSMPFGVLPAYLLFYGKLSQDSEVTAMRACGFSHFRIMWPGAIFGLLIMLFSYQFKNIVESRANTYFLQLKSKVLSQKPVIQLLDNVFLNIGGVQLSFQSAERVQGGDDILHEVYAVDIKNKRTIRSRFARIYVNPDNPEHYIVRFINGDMNQLTTPPIPDETNTSTQNRRNDRAPLDGVVPALSASNMPAVGIITNESEEMPSEDGEPETVPLASEETLTADDIPEILPVETEEIVEIVEAQPVVIEEVIPVAQDEEPIPERPREEFYVSSFGSMTMNNFVFLPSDGFFRGPETMTFHELQTTIYSDERNRLTITAFEKAKRNKQELDRLYMMARFVPSYLVSKTQDELDKVKAQTFIENNIQDIITERENAHALYRSTRSQLPNLNLMRLHEKWMLPVSAFFFALLALPLGLFGARSGRGEGLSISLVVTLVFYGFKSAIENAVGKNALPPEGIWIPTLVFAFVALVLYTQKVME